MSTAEPLTTDGMSTNRTKTPCSRYVFNTALTRAKSLVVCAGNPFLLMKIEKEIDKHCFSWKEYIRRCVLSKTFYVTTTESKNLEDLCESLKDLQRDIFTPSDFKSDMQLITKDSILKSYQKTIQEIPQYKNCKLQISQVQKESRWGIVKINEIETHHKDTSCEEKGIICELSIKNEHLAEAIPLDMSKRTKPIIINGFNHRRGAFDGDIVGIHVFSTQDDKECGKVVFFKEARHPTKYICRADRYNVIYFYPLDKSVPAIVNLPKISKEQLQYQDYMPTDYITIFKMSSLQSDQLPQIKELIPSDVSQNLLFVVQILGWSPKYWKPLGAVVEVLPFTSSLFFTERLFRIVHDIEESDDNEFTITPFQISPEEHVGLHYDQAFTIDFPNQTIIDDAISLVPLQEGSTYRLAVLITNVAKYIPKDCQLDKIAKKRGTSAYGGDSAIHMLPQKLATQIFSLNYNTTHDVLAVTATIVLKDGEINEIVCNDPEKAHVTSQACLTYKVVQDVLDDKPIEDDEIKKHLIDFNAKTGGMGIADTLKLLYKIAIFLREKRLLIESYGVLDSAGDHHDCWQSHFLVTEIMIWANLRIAEYLSQNLMQMPLLCRQLPPLAGNISKFRNIFQETLDYSLALKKYSVVENMLPRPLIVTGSVIHLIKKAYENCHQKSILWALSNNNLYPQLSRAEAVLKKIVQRSEYVSAKFDETLKEENICVFAHDSLNVHVYTHFTSPIQCYFDILVQRLVLALLDKDVISYTHKELQDICRHLNLKGKLADRYEQSMHKARLARDCETALIKMEAFVSQPFPRVKDQVYQLHIPLSSYNVVFDENTEFEYSDLNINRYDNENEPKWHIVLASLDNSPNDLLNDPRVANFTNSQESLVTRGRSYCHIQASVFHYISQSLEYTQKQMKCVKYNASVISNTIEVYSDLWDLAHQCLKLPSREIISSLIKKLPDLPHQKQKQSHLLNLEFTRSPIVIYNIARTFQTDEVINVWLGKSFKQALPSPELHLLEIAPTFRVCIQHNQNPVECFCEVHLQQASRESYHSIYEYIELWSKVLVAEAAYVGINTRVITLIKNANLKWPKLFLVSNCIDDIHYEPDGQLTLEIPSNKLHIFDFIKIKTGDLVCARYDITDQNKDLTAVFHFVVTRKKYQERMNATTKTVLLEMKAMGSHCWISQELKPYLDLQPLCEIQIIEMLVSFR